MKAQSIVNKLLLDVTPTMHKTRRASLHAALSSLLSGSDLSITALGRNINSATSEKHQIKRSMRLCSNPKLYHEIYGIYAMMSRWLVGQQSQPVILVDWSDLDTRKQHFLLRASIAVDGRSLTLIERIYTVEQKEKPSVHKAFMLALKSMLPTHCKPVIVSDAGFRVPWFKLITSLGWDFIGRVRNKTMCRQHEEDEFILTRTLYERASPTAKPLGRYLLRRKNSFACGMVIYQQCRKGRKHKTANGKRSRQSSNSRANASREQEPWLLATSLPTNTVREAKKVVKIYRSRMQIEESFRDLKTGLGFAQSQTRTLKYLAVLLLIAMLAQYVLFLIGVAVTLAKKQWQYQANSVKHETVLSYQFIGLRAFQDKSLKLYAKQLKLAYAQLQLFMSQHVTGE